jgi:hypothetical protein
MSEEILYENLALHFQKRAAVRATSDVVRHTDSPFIAYLEALATYAQFAEPILLYLGQHAADHLIEKATDGVIDKALEAARGFRQKVLDRLKREAVSPTQNQDLKEFDTVSSEADTFSEPFIRQASTLKEQQLEEILEIGQKAARQFVRDRLGFDDDGADHVTVSILIDIRKVIKRERDANT